MPARAHTSSPVQNATIASTRDVETTRTAGLVAASLGLLATLATGAACTGPFIAILMGVGGFGWLTRYAHLQLPASLLTAALLAIGFHRSYGPAGRGCHRRLSTRLGRVLLWTATLLAIAIQVVEYAVLPNL